MAKSTIDARNPGVAIHTWVKLSSKIELLNLAEKEGKSLSKFTEEIIEQWLKDNVETTEEV